MASDALSFFGLGVLQNAQVAWLKLILQPLQTLVMQQTLKNECPSIGNGIGSVHIEQKSPSGLSSP